MLAHIERGLQSYFKTKYKVTIDTVIRDAAKPNIDMISNMWVYGVGNKAYDAYILSPLAKKYKLQISYIKDDAGKNYSITFIVLQDKKELKL